jgi:hypothetical protein
MAITATKLATYHLGSGQTEMDFSVTFDTVYPTANGETWNLSAATLFPNKVFSGHAIKFGKITNGHRFLVDFTPGTSGGPTNCKLQLFLVPTARGAMIEASATTNYSTLTCRMRIRGY